MTMSRALRLMVATAMVGGGMTALAPGTASAAAVNATVANVIDTSAWPVPSPDPSGITWDSVTDRLIVSDAEIDEMPLYADRNIYVSSRAGVQDARRFATTVGWTREPTGVAFRPSDRHLFMSDDNTDLVFQVAPGPDGIAATTDDVVVNRFSTVIDNVDPEDLAVDLDVTREGNLLVIDGRNKEVFEYDPGSDNRLGTSDDDVTHFDVRVHGALDPEGIAYHKTRGTILVLDQDSRKIYEYSRTHALLNTINIAGVGTIKAAGLAVAPASNGSGAENFYVVDRGIDNNDDPTENDGRIYELAASLPAVGDGGGTPTPTPTNTAPVVSAGPDATVTMPNAVSLQGSVTDDGLPTGSTLAIAWSKASGPGTVSFASRSAAATTATFSVAGTYVLRLRASDGALATVDTVTVVVSSGSGSGTNAAPVVSAGPDQAVTRPGAATLQGSVTDDGLPTASTLAIRWSKASGPGTVRFANNASPSTTATFSLPGTYVLRLRADDGALAKADTVTVVVS